MSGLSQLLVFVALYAIKLVPKKETTPLSVVTSKGEVPVEICHLL